MSAREQLALLAARESYGQLVALLASKTRDIAAAEDALGEAFSAAMSQWPNEGVPENPRGWLIAVAKRRWIDSARHESMRDRHAQAIASIMHEDAESLPDRRLRLMFACAHPGIDAGIRAPLMLQTILGLTAEQIGQAFLVAPSTMGQRLSRAKRKIRDAGVPFDTSAEAMTDERLAIVCEAIYAAFSTGYNEADPAVRTGLSSEAIWLGRLLHRERPEEPEVAGLLALMLFIDARRDARRDDAGAFVPLDQQDTDRWHQAQNDEAAGMLAEASKRENPGRFQLEAAIQSVHAARAMTRATDWVVIERLYRVLLGIAPTLGARVAHIASIAEVDGATAADEALAMVPVDAVSSYQPFWALRAHLDLKLGRDASEATARAISLTEDEAVRSFLLRRLADSP